MTQKIFYVGDSITQYNDYTTYPQTGMGQALILYIKQGIRVINLARNGRSTKSFLAEGRFERVKQEIAEGDLLLIQFGHNDEKLSDPARGTNPYGDFQENLLYMINVAREAKAYPVLITSLTRRIFAENGKIDRENHGAYPKAVIELGVKENVPVIDLCKESMDYLESIGDEESKKYYMNFGPKRYEHYPEGKTDNSHLRYDGAVLFSGMVAKGLKELGGIYASVCVNESMSEEEKAIETAMLKDW